uniref:Uncharacterized protein n=1 Tax=Branchiostoma floridae TaxID=7739 RepID=C3Z2S1_BRAFL|eukprot:XP_002597310.1 hypothetical protein BRAFLDRAFT_118181 [Branchiostoma floridae]
MGYDGKYLQGMGWTLVVMGSLNIILGIAADAAFASMGAFTIFHYISAPIWNGIFVVITGILAISSGKKPTNKGLMVGLMILGIFTIMSAVCCFSLGIVGSIVDSSCGYGWGYGYGSWSCHHALLWAGNFKQPPCCPCVPGAQGVPYTTVSAAGGMPQQQVFIAQHPYPTAAPMQGYYGAQAPPPYMQQSNIGAAPAQAPAAAQPPAETKTQPPA